MIWQVKTSCRQTSLHPGLSTSWCVLACSGWPAFTGFRTTLSPITTCNHTEQRGEPWNKAELAHLELPKMQTTGWMMADSFCILSLASIPGPFTAKRPRPRPATPGIPGPRHHHHLPDLKWVINVNFLASGMSTGRIRRPAKSQWRCTFTPPTPPPPHLTPLRPRTKADFSGLHHPKPHSVRFLISLDNTHSSSRKKMLTIRFRFVKKKQNLQGQFLYLDLHPATSHYIEHCFLGHEQHPKWAYQRSS